MFELLGRAPEHRQARTPSSTRRRVSYPVSDSMSCIRRARVPVLCAALALRIEAQGALLWVRHFADVEDLQQALRTCKETCNHQWLIERIGFRAPVVVRRVFALPPAS